MFLMPDADERCHGSLLRSSYCSLQNRMFARQLKGHELQHVRHSGLRRDATYAGPYLGYVIPAASENGEAEQASTNQHPMVSTKLSFGWRPYDAHVTMRLSSRDTQVKHLLHPSWATYIVLCGLSLTAPTTPITNNNSPSRGRGRFVDILKHSVDDDAKVCSGKHASIDESLSVASRVVILTASQAESSWRSGAQSCLRT